MRPHGMAENKDWLDEYLTEVASLCYKARIDDDNYCDIVGIGSASHEGIRSEMFSF